MKIPAVTKGSYIDLQVTDLQREHLPSVCLSARVVDGEFSGARPGVWISCDELDAFVEAFRACERLRRGDASLGSMSPGEFNLRFAALDTLGHFEVTYLVTAASTGRGGSADRSLSGSFEVDSEYLGQVVEGFRAIARQVE